MNPSVVAPPTRSEPVPFDEDALVLAAKRDPSAFASLYREYLTPIYRYALARVGNVQDAQDVTSQTFMAAVQEIRGFRGSSKFSTWLFGIARNKCADNFRRHGREDPAVSLDHAELEASSDQRPEELAEQHARLDELIRAMRTLSRDEAEALSLRLFAGLDAMEAGVVMGKTPAAVKMLVLRAVRNLRPRFQHWLEEA